MWAHCADAEGLVVDPAPRRERLTPHGLGPTGRLPRRSSGPTVGPSDRRTVGPEGHTEPVDLGELGLIVEFPVPGADPEGDPYEASAAHHWERLLLALIAAGPSVLGAALFDLVVEAEGRRGPGRAPSGRGPVRLPAFSRLAAHAADRLCTRVKGYCAGWYARVESAIASRCSPWTDPVVLMRHQEHLPRRLLPALPRSAVLLRTF